MKKFKSILLLIALLVCAAVLFGCANEAPAKGSVPAGDEIEKETAADVEKENDEAADKAPEETTAKPEETTAPPEETTAKPADTTAAPKPVETTAKPVETAKPKPVETTAAPVVEDPYADIAKVQKPSDELIRRISEDYTAYWSKVGYDVEGYVIDYYGKFGDCIPCFLDAVGLDHATAIVTQVICGVEFIYGDSRTIKVWRDGDFYSVEEAYKNGFLSKEDVLKLANLYRAGKGYRVTE